MLSVQVPLCYEKLTFPNCSDLDPFTAVDECVAAICIDPGDGEVGITLAEHVFFVQVGAG